MPQRGQRGYSEALAGAGKASVLLQTPRLTTPVGLGRCVYVWQRGQRRHFWAAGAVALEVPAWAKTPKHFYPLHFLCINPLMNRHIGYFGKAKGICYQSCSPPLPSQPHFSLSSFLIFTLLIIRIFSGHDRGMRGVQGGYYGGKH